MKEVVAASPAHVDKLATSTQWHAEWLQQGVYSAPLIHHQFAKEDLLI